MYARTSARDISIARSFEAPRELLWKSWTEPGLFRKWWGPERYTVPYARMDLRVGGSYLICTRSPEAGEFWVTGTYRQLAAPALMVSTASFADEKGTVVPAGRYGLVPEMPLETLLKLTFDREENGTRLILEHSGLPAGRDREYVQACWSRSLARLAAGLKKQVERKEPHSEP